MEAPDAPVCLRRAREEMLLALDSLSPDEENEHKAHADELIVEAVRAIQEEPDRDHDWARLSPSREP